MTQKVLNSNGFFGTIPSAVVAFTRISGKSGSSRTRYSAGTKRRSPRFGVTLGLMP